MKKEILFASILVLLYSGCSQKGTILDSNSTSKSQSFERGRIIEQKKVLISKDQLSKTISQNKSSSTPKKVDLIVVALEATNAVANSITSKNEIEAYEIKIDVNNKIYTAYIDYEFSIGTMVSFIVNADNSISNIQSKYLTK